MINILVVITVFFLFCFFLILFPNFVIYQMSISPA